MIKGNKQLYLLCKFGKDKELIVQPLVNNYLEHNETLLTPFPNRWAYLSFSISDLMTWLKILRNMAKD